MAHAGGGGDCRHRFEVIEGGRCDHCRCSRGSRYVQPRGEALLAPAGETLGAATTHIARRKRAAALAALPNQCNEAPGRADEEARLTVSPRGERHLACGGPSSSRTDEEARP